MPVVNQTRTLREANRMRLQIHHFARGTYPEATGSPLALPLNRFFLPIDNPDGNDCTIQDANLTCCLRPGCAYFIPSYHEARVKLSENLRFLSIQFTLECWEGVDLFSRCRAVREIENPRYRERAEEAFETENPFIAASLLRGVTQDFASEILAGMKESDLDFVTRFAEFLPELEYIRTRGTAMTTVEELAAVRGMTRETFSRKFSASLGMTPKQFLTRTLLNRPAPFCSGETGWHGRSHWNWALQTSSISPGFFRKQTGSPRTVSGKSIWKPWTSPERHSPDQESGTASEISV